MTRKTVNPTTLFKKTITYSFYLLFFLAPLILTTSNYELFEFPKMLFVYAMTTIIAGAWVSLWIVQRKITIKRSPFDYFFLFFLVSQVLSTIFSVHPYTSIFGYYSRFHGGLLSSICYIVLFYALASNLNKKNLLFTVYCLLFTAALSSLYAIAEHFGIDSAYWVQDVQNRVFSTLGQPNWLAAFLTTLIPITMAWAIKPPKSKFATAISLLLLNTTVAYGLTVIVSGKTLPTTLPTTIFFLTIFSAGVFLINAILDKTHKKIFELRFLNFYLLFTLFVTTVLFTKSRSGILAMIVSFVFFWFLLFLKNIKKQSTINNQQSARKKWKHFLASCFLLLASVLITGTEWTPKLAELTSFKFQVSSFKKKTLNLKPQTLNLKYAPHISESTGIRKAVWEGAIKVWQNWPLTGSGVETFAYSFYNFRPRSHNDVSEWDFLYNKAHNEYLNFLATTGILGTTAIFSIILIFFYLNLRKIFPENLLPYYLITLLPILLISLISPNLPKALIDKLIIYPPLLKPIGIALGLALIFTVSIIKIQKYKPLNTSYQLLATSYSASMLAIIITNFYGFSVVIIGLLSSVLLPALTVSAASRQPPAARKKKLETVTQYLYLSLISLISLIFLAKIYNYWQADYLFNKGKNLSKDGQLFLGIEILEKAIKLRPKEAFYHSELGETNAVAAFSLKQQNASVSAQQITAFIQKADKEAEKTLQLNPVHINFYKSSAKIYLTLAQIDPVFYQKAIKALEKGWQLSPTDPKLPYNLGLIAQALGKNEAAEKFFEKTIELRPAYRKAWLDLGEIRTKLDKKNKAADAYNFILENINPEDELAKKLLEQTKL